MTRDEITGLLKELLERDENVDVDVSKIDEKTPVSDIGFDSLSILEFMYEIENRFDVKIEVGDLIEMERVGDLINYLQGKLVG